MVDEDLGQATIVYDDPDEGTVERTIQNEHVAYFQDHWTIKTGEDDDGNDLVRRIPHERVWYVERSVEEFEQEVKTIQHRIESFADGLRSTFLGGETSEDDAEPHRIEVEDET